MKPNHTRLGFFIEFVAKPLKIGITGGIGSGKTTLSIFFKQRGYPILHADEIGKSLLADDPEVRARIIQSFGEKTYSGNQPDRKYLANTVFNNKKNLKIINSIIHPKVLKKIDEKIREEYRDKSIVFVESAIIFEAGLADEFDYILLIISNINKRIKRISAQRGESFEEIIARMDNQLPDVVKKPDADFIIENNSSLEDLYEKGKFILKLLNIISK